MAESLDDIFANDEFETASSEEQHVYSRDDVVSMSSVLAGEVAWGSGREVLAAAPASEPQNSKKCHDTDTGTS